MLTDNCIIFDNDPFALLVGCFHALVWRLNVDNKL